MKRRDLIFAGLGLAALGTAETLKPRRKLILLQGGTIEDSLPITFGEWSAESASDLVGPELSGKVTRALYSQIVARIYTQKTTGAGVMMLAAYGDTQSDLLQVHRPEYCYPAVGFTLQASRPDVVPVGSGGKLPVRRVIAVMGDRIENIVYWTRIGEDLPRSAGEQRDNRIMNSIHGFVPDGILMRTSVIGESEASFQILDRFIDDLLAAIPTPRRKAFVGTKLAQTIA